MQSFLQSKQNKQQGALLVEIWSLSVSEGVMGAIHGCFSRIQELYVPTLDLVVNLEGEMNVFFSDGKRYKPITKNSIGYGKIQSPKLVKTVILEGSQAETIRNLAEIQLLYNGIKKDAKGVLEALLLQNPSAGSLEAPTPS